MERAFHHQGQKKDKGMPQRQSKDSKPVVSSQIHPFHSTILNLQQTYGNRYVQGVVEGDRIPCRELCGQNGPSLTTHLAPHSCGSCPFHTRSIKQMTPATPSSSSTQPIQAKLKIGKPGDMYEQEADRVAETVLQRQCSSPECKEEETVQRKTITPIVQPQIESEEEEEPIQMKQMVPEKELSQDGNEQILQQRGIGRPLEPETRKFMEARIGYDFGEVKIHTDSYAQRKSNELNAEAFTIGRDVFFNAGRYNPSVTAGKRLLAHELTHVVQQGRGNIIQRQTTESSTATCTENNIEHGCTDEDLLTAVCIGEAGIIKNDDAKRGVMYVVINRVNDSAFPNSILTVVSQVGQFHGFIEGIQQLYVRNQNTKRCRELAGKVISNPTDNLTHGALWFNQSCSKPCEQYCTTYLGDPNSPSPAHYFARRATSEERKACKKSKNKRSRYPCCIYPRKKDPHLRDATKVNP